MVAFDYFHWGIVKTILNDGNFDDDDDDDDDGFFVFQERLVYDWLT